MPSLPRSLAIVLSLGVLAGCQPYATYGSGGGIWSDRNYSDRTYSDRYRYPYHCPYGAYCDPHGGIFGGVYDRDAYWRARERQAREDEYRRRQLEAERRAAERRDQTRQQARREVTAQLGEEVGERHRGVQPDLGVPLRER